MSGSICGSHAYCMNNIRHFLTAFINFMNLEAYQARGGGGGGNYSKAIMHDTENNTSYLTHIFV